MDIHFQALNLAEDDRATTHALLTILREIERDHSYLERDVGSLHAYCTSVLKYSEGSATRRVNASRLVADVPGSVEMYRAGRLNLSHLSLAQSFFRSEEKHSGVRMTPAKKMDVLKRIEGKTQDQTRRLLRTVFPDAPVGRERTRARGQDTEITMLVDPEFMALLNEVREKNAHNPEYASIAGTFLALMRKELTRGHNAGVVSAAKRRAVFDRAGGRCEHVHRGVRCPRRHHLQVDHIVPRSRGGTDDLENLRALCRAHNLRKGDRV